MLLVSCSQIAPLWFYNVQFHCVKWGWCFQETGALMECLCSGSSKVLSLCWVMEVPVLNWIHQTGVPWSWGASPSLHQSFITDLHFGPLSRTVWSEELFLSGQNWRLNWVFGRFAIFLVLIRASMQLLSFLPWARACWRNLLAALAWQMWCDQLSFMQVKFSPLIHLVLFSSGSFNSLTCFLQRTQTTISSAWQTNRNTKRYYLT